MPAALAALASKSKRYDVMLGATIGELGGLIGQHLIQPINHSYLPNISQVWQQFTDPFYDLGWQYTVPYTIYTTGIGWRRDLVEIDPYAMVNGWDLLWEPQFKGKIAILNDYRETIGLGLLNNEITDLATADPRLVDAAGQQLLDLVKTNNPRLSNQAFLGLSSGHLDLQHAWSGQVAAAARYLPAGVNPGVLGYWFPPNGAGPVANDTMVIPRSAANPVLAHLFLNYLIDRPNAVANARVTGYMQPLIWMTPDRMVSHGVIPQSLIGTAVLESDIFRGLKELQLPAGGDAVWQQVWQTVVSAIK